MKLSALLAPLIARKADHGTIMDLVLAYEAEQLDGLNKRRENDAKRQAEKRKRDDSHVMSRDVTVTVSSHASASPAPDLENKQTNKQENKQENKIDASPSAQPKRGTRIPDDFLPDRAFALSHGLSPSDAETEAAQFIDFWRGKPGKDGLKLDWPATWRTWVRNAIKRQTPRRSQGPPKPVNMWIEEGRKRGILDDPASTGRLETGFGGGPSQGSNSAGRIAGAGTG